MDYKATVSTLYFLLIHADGNVGEKEKTRGTQMMQTEGIDEGKFNLLMEKLKLRKQNDIYMEAVAAIKKLSMKNQLRCIAWLCVVANADGFMDKKEWMLIYKVYQNELGLRLDDIMKVQKDLNAQIHGKAFHSLSVQVA